MCLKLKEHSKGKIAEENIPCYKHFHKNGKSEHMNFKYVKGKETEKVNVKVEKAPYSNKFEIDPYSNKFEINRGYHSRKYTNFDYKSRLFIIPKGVRYFEGRENYGGEGVCF